MRRGRQDLWAIFDGRILAPALAGTPPVPYERLVAEFGLQSPKQAANAVVTARRMFLRHLHRVVSQYAPDPAAVAAEIADLQRILSRSSAAPAGPV